MDFPELPHLLHWFDETIQLLQRFFIVVVAAFICIRFEWLRQALRGAELKWRYRVPAILVFGMLSIAGTHSGIIIDVHEKWQSIDLSTVWPNNLRETQAIVGFRDTMTLVSGLIGGPWVGFGTGLLAGVERYQLGGLAGLASGLATMLLGIFAGLIRYFRPHWVETVKGVFGVALLGTFLHRCMILIVVQPFSDAWVLSKEVMIPVGVVNTLGCVLFFWIMRDLDRDRLENQTQEARLLMLQAELRAFRAQTNPHFLKNALADISSLIRTDAEKARTFLAKLREFFADTLIFSGKNTIALVDELIQLERYIDLKRLSLGNKLPPVNYCVPDKIGHFQVAPGCLLTLVENALDHGFVGRQPPYELSVSAKNDGEYLLLQVTDNGRGISPERLLELGKCPVDSKNEGGGVALHQLLQSLRLVFGKNVALRFDSVVDKGTVATLRHPKRSELC